MQEKEKNVSTVKFLSVFGEKITDSEKYNPEDDTCDQRAPVNSPDLLYQQFVVGPDIMDELEAESVEDFDNDIYPYEDRSELGEDIAEMSRRDLKAAQSRYFKSVQNEKEQKPVEPAKADGEAVD